MKHFLFGFLFIVMVAGCSEAFSAVTALNVTANTGTSINSVPYKMQWLPTANGVAANSSRYVTRAVQYTSTSFGALAKSFIFSPGGLALQAALIAAGYFIDGGEVYDEDPGSSTPASLPAGSYGYYYGTQESSGQCFSATYQGSMRCSSALLGYTFKNYTGSIGCCAYVDGYWFSGTAWGYKVWQTVGSVLSNRRGTFATGHTEEDPNAVNTPDPLVDTDLAPLFDYGAPFQDWIPDILTDPVTGKPLQTQELTDVMADLESDLNATYDTDPVTVPTTDPVTEDTGTEGQMDELIDCDFFPTLCEFLEWFREGEDFELDTTEPAGIHSEIDAGSYADFGGPPITFGGASTCPAPYTFDVFGHSLSMSYTAFCTLSEMLNPILLAVSTMVGMFYFVRVVSS